jgi:hypothetical protein
MPLFNLSLVDSGCLHNSFCDYVLIAAADAVFAPIGVNDGRQTHRDYTLDRRLVFAVSSIPAATLLNRN